MTLPNLDGLLRPLSARSLIASALLGSHPPSLPGRLLVAMAERFGISGGTARVALSRMVDRGELTNLDGVYTLGTSLLERQSRQDGSRQTPQCWDGAWEQVVITTTGRSAADRGRLRRELTTLGLGELREGVWMRPANLDPLRQPRARSSVAEQTERLTVAPIDTAQGRGLVEQLFELGDWADTAIVLHDALLATNNRLDAADPADDAVVTGFNLAAATLRHFVHDPQLPAELMPADWPADRLREAYTNYERSYQQLLRDFFRSVR
ncbi:MAG: PaaX family transcriptional regulator C-terminal domain-containing protein [Actinomycetota bacterium]